MTNFTWMIGGEAGFGIMTTGLVFSKMATRSGYHIFDYIEYPSLIRGGHNAYEVHVSEIEVSYLNPTIDVLVCLNKETYDKHKNRLTSASIIVYDKEEFEIKEWELACYNNIGVSYYFKSDYKQSLDYFIKAMKIIEERGDKKWMSYCYSNIGNVYSDMEDYTSAKIYFLKSLKILEEIRDLNGLATIYCNLALIQNTLAERNIDQNQNLSLSLEYGNKAMEIAKEINSAVLIYQAAGIIKRKVH